jgi:hypothetical protein
MVVHSGGEVIQSPDDFRRADGLAPQLTDHLRQASIDPLDYHGLQLDTRFQEDTKKHLVKAERLPSGLEAASLDRDQSSYSTNPYSPKSSVQSNGPLGTSARSKKRICGLRQRLFWTILVVVLVIVASAAVVGGVLGASRNNSSASSATPPARPSPSRPAAGGNTEGQDAEA